MIGFISKLFGGSKSEKDVKNILPLVTQINEHFAQLQLLTNDALRQKTQTFKATIKAHLADVDAVINQKKQEADALNAASINLKDEIYQQIDKLKKDRDLKIEEILKSLLPEAFAVVKETARRFSTHAELVAQATDLDRNLSVKKEHVRIENDKSIYKNSWSAAGNMITWNMVHYDVQLIGGVVLHLSLIHI